MQFVIRQALNEILCEHPLARVDCDHPIILIFDDDMAQRSRRLRIKFDLAKVEQTHGKLNVWLPTDKHIDLPLAILALPYLDSLYLPV